MDVLNLFGVTDIRLLPERVMDMLFGPQRERERVYQGLIEAHGGDMSYDWFQTLYEQEFAQRKEKKQDFTPTGLCSLLSKIVGDGSLHEPTAGTGGLVISHWVENCMKQLPWEYRPSLHIVDCWEISDRAVPLLLLNLSIRGIMGYVTHGDVLTYEVKQRYALLNRRDDPLAFSEVIRLQPGDCISSV